MAERRAPITLTDSAAEHVRALLAKRGTPAGAVRIGIKAKGCSGMAYTLEFADAPNPLDEVVEDKGVTVLIDPKAAIFVLGTEMDWADDKMSTGFVFRNPNEKGRCGCGESFHV